MTSLKEEKQIKKEVLNATNFGERVAEEEAQLLNLYFVKTRQWKKIISGEIDILYGPKGSGKSAIYSLLLKHASNLSKQNVILIPAEKPQDSPVMQELAIDPPTREDVLKRFWKIYFLILLVSHFRSTKLKNKKAKRIISILEEAGLMAHDESLLGKLRSALRSVRNMRIESFEAATLKLDHLTGNPKWSLGKICFGEPTPSQLSHGFISVDALLKTVDEILSEIGKSIWLVIDRLDVAFAHSNELEGNALRALFGVYHDIRNLDSLSLKIFLRSDIWRRITDKRVPEADHITRYDILKWDANSLMELTVNRLLHNQAVKDYYKVNELGAEAILSSSHERKSFFYRSFPSQVLGKKNVETFQWILDNTRDGLGVISPRDLIHLLNETVNIQLRMLDEVNNNLLGERLFSFEALKEALPAVSTARYELTIGAENPEFGKKLQWLEGQKARQTVETLSEAWGIGKDEVHQAAEELMEAGLFKRKGTRDKPTYHIAPIYRSALKMGQRTKKVSEHIYATIPKAIQLRQSSKDAAERAASVRALARLNTGEAFQQICAAFDDPAQEVRDAAVRALYELSGDRAETFTRALRESPPERRRQIGASLASSGLADEAVSQLTGESRDRTYDAFSLLFLMAKAGETAPLIRAVESHADNDVRLAVVKLLALSGQQEVLPSFRHLAVRGSLPTEVRAAVMEAIYQISSAGTPPQPQPTKTVS